MRVDFTSNSQLTSFCFDLQQAGLRVYYRDLALKMLMDFVLINLIKLPIMTYDYMYTSPTPTPPPLQGGETDKTVDEAYICLKLSCLTKYEPPNIVEYFGAAMLPYSPQRGLVQLFLELMPSKVFTTLAVS